MKYLTVAPTPGCCGVAQICFMVDYESSSESVSYVHGTQYSGETWAHALREAMESYENGQLFQTWFVKRETWSGDFAPHFDAEELRDYVRSLKDAVHLEQFTNPNSDNLIDGWQWVNHE